MRALLLVSLLTSASSLGCLAGCVANNPGTPAASPTPKVSTGPALRPAVLAGASYQTTKFQLQRYKNVYFKDKASGAFIPPAVAQGMAQADVLLEPGDFDELLYAAGKLRYALYGRTEAEQPYVVERAMDQAAYDALEKGLDADGFWGLNKDSWDATDRLPFYAMVFTVGDAGYQAGLSPNLNRLKTVGPLLTAYLDQMGNGAKLAAGVSQTIYAQQVMRGTVTVRVTVAKPDVAGDPVEEPVMLKAVQVDAGKGASAATVGAGTNGFSFPQPVGTGFVSVLATVTDAGGKTNTIALPIRAKKG